MTLTKRSSKGSALSYDEMDGNFTHLGGTGTYHNDGIRIGPPGTVLEMLVGHADGRTLVGHSGSYTLQNVTTHQNLTSTHTSIGLDIDYIPPTGTKTVLYEAQFQFRGIDADPLLHFQAIWDGNILGPSKSTHRVSAASDIQKIYHLGVAIEVNSSNVSVADARIGEWTTAKTLSWTGREYSGSYEGRLHATNHWDGTGTDQFIRPMLKVTAIA